MNLTQLEVLVAIVETGSLTEAAEAVGLTQSAVSHALKRLEAELGVHLIERGHGEVSVTRIGEEVLQHVRAALNQIELIHQKTARERGLSVGKLRFGIVPNIPSQILTGILRDFQHQYPNIEVVLFEGNERELRDWIAQDIIDIGTVMLLDSYRAIVPLAQSPIHILISAKHPLAKEAVLPLKALENEVLIGPKAEYETLAMLPEMKNINLPHSRYEVSAYRTIFAMVREGMGISMMPQMMVDPNAEGLLSLPTDPPLVLRAHLAANTDSPAATTFMQMAHRWASEAGIIPD